MDLYRVSAPGGEGHRGGAMTCTCGATIEAKRPHRRYCSKRCRAAAARRRAGARTRSPRLVACSRCGRPFWPWKGRPSHARKYCCRAPKKEQRTARAKLTDAERRERGRIRSADRYARDPKRKCLAVLEYKRAHPDKNREYGHRRRARERQAASEPVDLRREIDAAIECAYCGRAFTLIRRRHVEHIVAIANGGGHTRANIVAACDECNARKGRKTIEEWIAMLPIARRLIVRALCRERGITVGGRRGSF